MGLLALDIETASPFEEPDDGHDTDCFEWVATAVGYYDDTRSTPETDVLFRRGGWEDEHTAELLEQLFEWCAGRDIEAVLTYNGAWFDLKHIGTWATDLEETGVRENAFEEFEALCTPHIDLAPAAADEYAEELWDDQPILPDWKAYQLAGIDNESIWYDDYAFDEAYFEGLGIDDAHVKGEHVGQVLGERYVNGVVHGLEGTQTHRTLTQLLTDYAESDVADLFALYESLGGERLHEGYQYPLAEVLQ